MGLPFSQRLDSCLVARLRLGNHSVSTFLASGSLGILLAFTQSLILAGYLDLSSLIVSALLITGLATFFLTIMITKILAAEERIIYYHHQIVIAGATAVMLLLIRQPILEYLDITILAIGTILACGRVGCLMVGCCHGRMCRLGICYRREHARQGFPSYLVGVRLFPIQLVESIFVFGVVVFGAALVLKGFPAGSALAFYVIAYAFGRFWIEFARGDSERPYVWSFSEAQWTSLFLTIAVVCAEYGRILPASTWHIWIPLCLGSSMLVISLGRRLQNTPRFDLLHPRHVRELAGAIQIALGAGRYPMMWNSFLGLKPDAPVSHLAYTSLGVQISAGDIIRPNSCVRHYTLSKETDSLTAGSARLLAELIARLNHASCRFELLERNSGVFHLLFETDSAKNSVANPQRQRSVVPKPFSTALTSR